MPIIWGEGTEQKALGDEPLNSSQQKGESLKIAVVAEYDPTFPPHAKTDEALKHTGKLLTIDIESRWISTGEIVLPSGIEVLHTFDAVLIGSGSPYKAKGS